MIRVPKPRILAELPDGHAVIQASAGTGKTWTLERVVVDLILRGTPLERILVVTFTEKASLEINQRVRKILEDLLALEADACGTEDPAWDLTEEARARLAEALRTFDQATLSTIHGFCRQVLQDAAFEGGSLFRLELADGQTLFRRAFRDQLRNGFHLEPHRTVLRQLLELGRDIPELEDFLWDVHQQEGDLEPAPMDLSAPLAAFPEHLLGAEVGLRADLQAVPHATVPARTRNAALERLGRFLGLMAAHPTTLDFLAAWKKVDFSYLQKTLAKLQGPGLAGELAAWFETLPPGVPQSLEPQIVHHLLGPVQARLAALKAEEGLYDFKDMIHQVRDALRAGPAGQALAARLGARHEVAIIDEFQDTDAAQWEIFRRVFVDQGLRLIVIGDPKQAIYGFRGGDLPTYRTATQVLLAGAAPVELAENHRSTQDIIHAYNHLLTHTGPALFGGENRYEVPVACGKPDLAFAAADGTPLKPVRVVRLETLVAYRSKRAVAHTLALEIQELIQGGACLGPREALADPATRDRHRLGYRDVQVLAPKRAEALAMAEALRALGVPCAFYKQDGLLQSEEALDLLDLLRAVEAPRDPGRLARALLTPFFGYAPGDLEGLPGLREDHPVRLRLKAWHALAQARDFGSLLDDLIHGSGLAGRLRLAAQGDRALTNHLHLAELVGLAARERTRDLADLVRLLGQWVAKEALPPGEDGSLQRLEAEPDAVQILTLHQSKGLEAPVVALSGFTGAKSDLKVHRFQDGDRRKVWLGTKGGPRAAAIDEEAQREAERLIYVALTRAKARLLLPCQILDDKNGDPIHLRGVLGALNPVLRAVVEGAERPDLFEEVELRRDPEQPIPPPPPVDLSAFALPAVPAPPLVDYEAARRRSRTTLVTSYTHLTSWVKRHTAPEESLVRHGDQDQPAARIPAGDVPGGPRAGQMMHTLLETMDLDAARGVAFEAWWTEGRRTWAHAVLKEAGFGPEFAEPAARRAFRAVHAPLPSRSGSFALVDHDPGRLVREMDFVGSYFDTGDFVNGAMDAVFQHGGRTFVLDWKNDLLPSYAPRDLEAHADAHYRIQVRLYTWVTLRWLGLDDEADYERSFGGLHYVFLRGLDDGAPGQGIWHHRPTWAEVLGWRADLLRLHGEVTRG